MYIYINIFSYCCDLGRYLMLNGMSMEPATDLGGQPTSPWLPQRASRPLDPREHPAVVRRSR